MLKLKNPIYIIFSLMGHRLIQFHISACSQCGKGKSETNLHRFTCWDNTKVSTDPVKQDCFLGIHDWSNANTIINLKQISFTDNKTKGLRQQTIWQTLWRGHCLILVKPPLVLWWLRILLSQQDSPNNLKVWFLVPFTFWVFFVTWGCVFM